VTADALGLLVVNACFLAGGLGVTATAGWWSGRPPLRSLGLAYLAGVAAYGVVAQFLYVVGAPLSRWQVVAVCAVLACGTLVRRRTGEGPVIPSWRWLLPIGAFLALLVVDLWFQPLWAYDTWTFWTPKARALAALDGLDARWFTSADLLNRDYPILLPAVEAAGFRFTGYEVRLLDAQSWVFLVAFAGAFWEIVAARARTWIAAGVLATIVVAPSMADQLASAEADVPLAAFVACGGLCVYLFVTERSGPGLVLFAVLAAGAVATKVEGSIFVVALAIAAAAFAWRTSRRAAGSVIGAAAGAFVVGLLPWRIWVAVQDVPSQTALGRVFDVGFLAGHVSRLPYATAYVLGRVVDPRAWLLLVPLCIVATVAAWRAGAVAEALFALAVVALSLAGLLIAYWTTPFELHYHLATSARRVITPPLLFWAALAPILASARDTDKPLTRRGYPLRS
jgi:hypothetical protein